METRFQRTAKKKTSGRRVNRARPRKRLSGCSCMGRETARARLDAGPNRRYPRHDIPSPNIGVRTGLFDQLGNLWAEFIRILDRLCSWPRVPALGDFENSIAGFEHAAGHIGRFLAGQPNHDRRDPARIAPLYFFLGALSQSWVIRVCARGAMALTVMPYYLSSMALMLRGGPRHF